MRKVTVGDFRIGPEEKAAVMDVLDSGRISEGPRVAEFEREWAKFIGVRYCVATSSGAGALITSLTVAKASGRAKPGAKVITSPLTYIADASAISVTGFAPVFVDIDPDTLCMDPEALAQHLASVDDPEEYQAVIPVDLMGYPCDIERIGALAQQYGLVLLEDPAEAHGTLRNGKRAGSQADMAVFSFYIAHNIQAGEMGAIVTDSLEVDRLARKIKAQGRACSCRVCTRASGACPQLANRGEEYDFDPRFSHDLIGYNFKTMEFQAALASVQLRRADEIIQRRLHNVRKLNDLLAKYQEEIKLPHFDENVSYLAYPLVIRHPERIDRRTLRQRLEAAGVETRPLFGCIPTQQPAYAHLRDKYLGKLPNAEYIGSNGFYIGCHQYLEDDDLEYVAHAFEKALAR